MEEILKALEPDYVSGFSLLGGEPFEPENTFELALLLKKIKSQFPQKSIWCYTGFVLDEESGDLKEKHKNTPYTKDLIALFEVLVDGPFIEELKDIRLKFRGSSNQRVIDVQKTLKNRSCVLYLN